MMETPGWGPRNSWHWSEDAPSSISFCVHALVLDGLSVPPFNRHAGGDGSLRALGLDAAAWREWVRALVDAYGTLGSVSRQLGGHPGPREPILARIRAAAEVLREPGSLCPGSAALHARLDARFADYTSPGEAWARRMSTPQPRHGSGRQQRALWKALTPFQDRLPSLSVFLVEYPAPAVMPLPPAACLIAPAPDAEGYARQLLAAASSLAGGG